MALNNEGANSETTQNYPVFTFHKKNNIQYSTGTGIYVIQGYKIFVYTWFVRTHIHGIIMSGFGDISTVLKLVTQREGDTLRSGYPRII